MIAVTKCLREIYSILTGEEIPPINYWEIREEGQPPYYGLIDDDLFEDEEQ